MNRWKSAAALAGAALILAGSLAACAPQEEASSQTGETSSQLALENDETATSLVVAELFVSQERTAALEEIAQKYMADFPQTQIEIATVKQRGGGSGPAGAGRSGPGGDYPGGAAFLRGAGAASGFDLLSGRVGGDLQPDGLRPAGGGFYGPGAGPICCLPL